MIKSNVVTVLGAGTLAGIVIYGLLNRGTVKRVVLIDEDEPRAKSLFTDLSDTTFLSECSLVNSNDWQEAGMSNIIIVAFGSANEEAEHDQVLEYLEMTKRALHKIDGSLSENSIIIVASYPTDIITTFVRKWTLHRIKNNSQVFGIGTLLDTIRLKNALSLDYEVAQASIPFNIIGRERQATCLAYLEPALGQEQQLISMKTINLTNMHLFAMRKAIQTEVQLANRQPYFGVSACVLALVKSVLYDEKRLRTVSIYVEKWDACVSMPVAVGETGAELAKTFVLSQENEEIMEKTAKAIREECQFLETKLSDDNNLSSQ